MTARAMTEDKPKTTERLVHELRQSEERHRALVELSPDAIFVNHEGKFSFLNPGAVKLFGADSQADLIGRSPLDFVDPDDRDLAGGRISRALRGEELPFTEMRLRRLDGATIVVETAATRLRYEGGWAMQAVVRDITERENVVGTHVEDFTRALYESSMPGASRERAEEAVQALSDPDLIELLLMPALGASGCGSAELAERLLRRFGSIAGIISAGPARLAEMAGIDARAMASLLAVREAAVRLTREEVAERPVLSTSKQLLAYVRASMGYAETEALRVLFLNQRNRLIADEVMHNGTIDHTPMYPREVAKRALEVGASALLLVHNHPSGDPQPSPTDIATTRLIVEAGRALGFTVHDHVIIARGSHASFRAMRLL